jgi:hypothetical protein
MTERISTISLPIQIAEKLGNLESLAIHVPHIQSDEWQNLLYRMLSGEIGTIRINALTSVRNYRVISLRINEALISPVRFSATICGTTLEISLTRTEADYWQQFFMKYRRDGIADVDHIDSEGILYVRGQECGALDVTIRVERSLPSVSAKEARKRLGMQANE